MKNIYEPEKGENKRKENVYLLKQIIGVWYNLECFNIYNAIKIQSAREEKFLFVWKSERRNWKLSERKKSKQKKSTTQEKRRVLRRFFEFV